MLLYDGEQVDIGVMCGASAELEQALRPFFPMPLTRTLPATRAIYDRQPALVEDVTTDPDYVPLGPVAKANIRSVLSVPMLKGDRCIGSITVFRRTVGAFPDKLVGLFQTFADQAVIAIENARLFRETNEALERQTATAEILRVISSSVVDTAPVFDKILESCERIFECEELGITFVEDGQVELGAYRGDNRDFIETLFPVPYEGSVTAAAIESGTTLHIADAAAADSPLDQRIADVTGNYSMAITPMRWEDRAAGAIMAIRTPPRPFTAADIELLSTFADQAVIAIENARLFREIEQKSHQLEVANQHKSDFLANMSHELRTPLNAVIGFSEVLLERMFGDLNEKQEDYLRDIHSSGKHLLSLINDILDLSKIEAGRMELDVEDFDLNGALDNALTLVRERAERHGITLGLETEGELGSFRADQRKFKQVMLNLLSNAVKFTPDGGTVSVRAKLDGDVLAVAVADTGIGIDPADQETIFDEFRQAGGDYTNKQEGTGLGLSLTRRIVELHGGTIGVESAPGEGSTFTFTLPGQP
ncbi:MAG: ATP-binding protein, partial [Gammaproteobacteria bacterium]